MLDDDDTPVVNWEDVDVEVRIATKAADAKITITSTVTTTMAILLNALLSILVYVSHKWTTN